MNQLWIIYIVVFCAVLLAVQGGYWFFTEQKRTRGAINRRLILARQNTSARDVFETLKRERGLVGLDIEQFQHLNDLVIQTGLRLERKVLVAIAFFLGVLFFVLFGFAFGFGPVAFVLSAVFAAIALTLFLALARRKRIARFSEQLPDSIDVIVRGVKSG